MDCGNVLSAMAGVAWSARLLWAEFRVAASAAVADCACRTAKRPGCSTPAPLAVIPCSHAGKWPAKASAPPGRTFSCAPCLSLSGADVASTLCNAASCPIGGEATAGVALVWLGASVGVAMADRAACGTGSSMPCACPGAAEATSLASGLRPPCGKFLPLSPGTVAACSAPPICSAKAAASAWSAAGSGVGCCGSSVLACDFLVALSVDAGFCAPASVGCFPPDWLCALEGFEAPDGVDCASPARDRASENRGADGPCDALAAAAVAPSGGGTAGVGRTGAISGMMTVLATTCPFKAKPAPAYLGSSALRARPWGRPKNVGRPGVAGAAPKNLIVVANWAKTARRDAPPIPAGFSGR